MVNDDMPTPTAESSQTIGSALRDGAELKRDATQSRAQSFPVSDDHLDAPDGAVVDGYERVGDRWVNRMDEKASSRLCAHPNRDHALGGGLFVCFECFARTIVTQIKVRT